MVMCVTLAGLLHEHPAALRPFVPHPQAVEGERGFAVPAGAGFALAPLATAASARREDDLR